MYTGLSLNQIVRVIQPGDNLYKIAREYHISVENILAANPGINPYHLMIGQIICIPWVCPTGCTTYLVKIGGTFYSIANKYSITVQRLIAANLQITYPNDLVSLVSPLSLAEN